MLVLFLIVWRIHLRKLKNHGFSLVQVILSGALVSGLGITMMKISQISQLGIKNVSRKSSVQSVRDVALQLMSQTPHCNESLRGKKTDASEDIEVKHTNGKVYFKKGDDVGDGVKIKSIRLNNKNNVPQGDLGIVPIVFEFEKKSSNNTTGHIKGFEINVVVRMSSSDETISLCSSSVTSEEAKANIVSDTDGNPPVANCLGDESGYLRYYTNEKSMQICDGSLWEDVSKDIDVREIVQAEHTRFNAIVPSIDTYGEINWVNNTRIGKDIITRVYATWDGADWCRAYSSFRCPSGYTMSSTCTYTAWHIDHITCTKYFYTSQDTSSTQNCSHASGSSVCN